MSIEYTELDSFYKASIMLLSSKAPQSVDVLFFHNRSYGDYTGLFEVAEHMFRRGWVRFIAVTNNEGERFGSIVPYEANPGKTECIRILEEDHHIPHEVIVVPEITAFHTRQENTAFLELSGRRGWTTGVILAQPHQLLRSMLGVVQAMEQTRYNMSVYTAAPDFTPWQEIVKGNQGLDEKPRFEHIEEELKRIRQYQVSGELATFDQLFKYLKTREENSLI